MYGECRGELTFVSMSRCMSEYVLSDGRCFEMSDKRVFQVIFVLKNNGLLLTIVPWSRRKSFYDSGRVCL